jgi:chemosensory pili system protein ChpA (sensor histidine kinase/response regulator)
MQGEKSRHSERSGKIFERSRPPENQMAAPKGACSESPQDDDTFFAAVQDYASQMQRLADAAHTAELDGIAAASALVVENAMLLAVADEAERSAALAFLAAWPNHLLQCLRQPDNSAIAQALVQHLCAAPQALGSAAALNLMHQLGSMGQQAQTLGTAATQPAPSPTAADISAALSLQPPADLDPDLLHSFYQEAPQQARTLVGLVQAFGLTTASQAQQEQLIQMQRLAHTLKGTGAIFGLQGLISMAHPLEDIFEQLQNTTARPHPDLPQLLNTALEAAYCLEQMVACVAGQDEPPAQAPAVLQKLGQAQQLLGLAAHNPQPAHPPNPSPAPQSSPSAEPASEAPRAAPAEPGLRVGQTAMENLFRLSAQISLASTAQQGRLKKIDARVQQLLAQNTRWQKNLAALGDALQQQNAATPQQGAGFDPLEFDQFQAWQEQLLSLQETAHDHQLLAWRIHAEVQDWALAQQADTQAVQALQHQVLQTRMRSAGSIRARAERAVHITAQSTGKRARLHLTGDAVDMDAALLGSLLSPLMHMLRNAVDHGIESPEQRQAAGKPAEGCVQLQFARQGSQIVLRCQDDGRGLDWAKVRQRGLDLGLLQAEQNCTPAELARLIFSPGFSTRSQVNQISGRGVGLDVVHSWAASVGGTVDVLQQAQAVGLCLELRFPATLAMQPALLVQAAGQKFALPAAQITQALAANMGQWEESATGLHFTHEGQRLPAHRLSHIVGLQSLDAPPLAQCAVVLIQHQHASTALAVDALLDAGQWLVQDLGRFSRHAKGATGVSVLEDGGLAVHLDLSTLLKQNLQPATQTQAKAPLGRPALPHILVVDDAYSVRSSLKQLLQDAGYRVSTARDGLEAIASLQAHPAHIVLTDLEMPNMNGAELAAHLRASADSQTLPIVMISSRTQDKHRQLAAAAGVNAYLGKPYVEAELLALIQRFLTEKPL